MVYQENGPNNEQPKKYNGDFDSSPLELSMPQDWVSPFSTVEMERDTIVLLNEIKLNYLRPCDWSEAEALTPSTQQLLMSPSQDAAMAIGAGLLPPDVQIEDALASIASFSAQALASQGVPILKGICIPCGSKNAEITASCIFSYAAIIPGYMCNNPEQSIQTFRYVTVHAIDNSWMSFETAALGKGCNPLVEAELMGKLHCDLRIRKI